VFCTLPASKAAKLDASDNLAIGDGTDGTDFALTFDGNAGDGVLTWMEDEDYFKFSDDIGKSLENAVFLELKRKHIDIFYYRDSNSECDFIVTEKSSVIEAIQVTYDMSDENTKNREIKGLLSACKHFNLRKGTIVTYDTEDEIIGDDIIIELIPFYRWEMR
jgi:predicted AAA+ superfamily ATPase